MGSSYAAPPPPPPLLGSRTPSLETGGTGPCAWVSLRELSCTRSLGPKSPGRRRTGGRCPRRGHCPKRGGPAGSGAWSLPPTVVFATRSLVLSDSLGLGRRGDGGQVLADAQGKGDATLFSRLREQSHLAVAETRGSVSGPSPHSCRGLARGTGGVGGVLGSEKPPLPGFVSPSWGRREGRGGRGAFGSARGELTDPRGQDAPERRQLRCGGAQPPPARRFPAPTSPGRRRRRRWAARDLSELATAEEDHVPSSRRS